jgi:hypothetical protein
MAVENKSKGNTASREFGSELDVERITGRARRTLQKDRFFGRRHIAVREQWYLRQWGSVKAKARRRDVPVPVELADALSYLQSGRCS